MAQQVHTLNFDVMLLHNLSLVPKLSPG